MLIHSCSSEQYGLKYSCPPGAYIGKERQQMNTCVTMLVGERYNGGNEKGVLCNLMA